MRVHRLMSPDDAGEIHVIEGSAALGYAPGLTPAKGVDRAALCAWASVRHRSGDTYGSLIRSVIGYTGAVRASGFRGNEHLNAIHARAITPTLTSTLYTGVPLVLACLTLATCAWTEACLDSAEVSVDWNEDGHVDVEWDGRTIEITPLPQG